MEERERKLTIDATVPLPDPDTLFAGLGPWTDETVDQEATYFDTADLRLTRAGVSLRFRSDDGWTVKAPATADASELRRDEHVFGGRVDARPAPAEELVLGWSPPRRSSPWRASGGVGGACASATAATTSSRSPTIGSRPKARGGTGGIRGIEVEPRPAPTRRS